VSEEVAKKHDIIQCDGLVGVGERVDPGDVYVNKQSSTNATENAFTGQAAAVPCHNAPLPYKSPIAANIDKVMHDQPPNPVAASRALPAVDGKFFRPFRGLACKPVRKAAPR
jgi:hypothetical protein